MRFLSAPILIATALAAGSANADKPGGNTLDYNNCSIFFSEKAGLSLDLSIYGRKKELMELFKSSALYASKPKFNGFSSWRYESNDGLAVVQEINSHLEVELKGVQWLSASQFGEKDCRIAGPAAELLHDTLRGASDANHSIVSKHEDESGKSYTLLEKVLICGITKWAPSDKPTCVFNSDY
jgi:hypothetical protein